MGIEMPKQLLSFDGSTVLETSVRAFSKRADIDGVVIVSPKDGSLDDIYMELAGRLSEEHVKEVIVARGGSERSDSVACGLAAVSKAASQKGIEEGIAADRRTTELAERRTAAMRARANIAPAYKEKYSRIFAKTQNKERNDQNDSKLAETKPHRYYPAAEK